MSLFVGRNIADLYDEQVQPVKIETTKISKAGNVVKGRAKWQGTRAEKEVRYAHFNEHKEASFLEKERWAIDLMKMALSRAEKPVVSCSFGIDSIMVLFLARKALVELGRDPRELAVVWNNTLNEFSGGSGVCGYDYGGVGVKFNGNEAEEGVEEDYRR